MIHQNSKIKWIDTSVYGVFVSSVDQIFQHYITTARLLDGEEFIDFSKRNVYIQDMLGYSKVMKISRDAVVPLEWLELSVEDRSILVTGDTYFPVYDISEPPTKGFHGDIKRNYTMKQVVHIDPSKDYLRIYDEDEKIEDFKSVTITRPDLPCDITHGYDIFTSSCFYNVNEIYTFGSRFS